MTEKAANEKKELGNQTNSNGKQKTTMRRTRAEHPSFITKKDVFIVVTSIVSQLLMDVIGLIPSIQCIAHILVNVAASCSTINAVARRGEKSPKGPKVRYHCRKLEGKGKEIETWVNTKLREQARSILDKKKVYNFAIDTNEKETYMKDHDDYVVKSKAKNGTNKFISHATLYAMTPGKRVTIAFKRIRKSQPVVEIVKFFVKVLEEEDYNIKRLYLDRGFYSVEIVKCLKTVHYNAIIAMPIRGPKKGLKSLLHGKKSHWIEDYEARTTIKEDGKNKAISEKHDIAAIAKYQKGRRKKHGVKWYAYAVIGCKMSLKRIQSAYRGRFGIETSYRIKNKSLGWTTSPMPELRTLYFGISLLIQNEWILVNHFYFIERKRGRPRGKPVFPYEDFLELLLEGCRDVLGRFDKVEVLVWRSGGPFG